MNDLPLILPDVDVHTASTSSPSLKVWTFSWNVLQRSGRSEGHLPADQDFSDCTPYSQAPESRQSPQSSRAGGCSPTNQHRTLTIRLIELLDYLTQAALGAIALASKPPAMDTEPCGSVSPARSPSGRRAAQYSYPALGWRQAGGAGGAAQRCFLSRTGLGTSVPSSMISRASMDRLPVDQRGCSSSSSPASPPDRPATRCLPTAHGDLSMKKDHQSSY